MKNINKGLLLTILCPYHKLHIFYLGFYSFILFDSAFALIFLIYYNESKKNYIVKEGPSSSFKINEYLKGGKLH